MRNIRVSFRDILPESSKSSAFWDMGWSSYLKWLPLFSPSVADELDGTSLRPRMSRLQAVRAARNCSELLLGDMSGSLWPESDPTGSIVVK